MIFKVDVDQDLCMIVGLKQEHESFKSAKFAKKMPRIGEKIYNTGAPDGISGPSIRILLDGYFSGCNFSPANYCLYTIPATFGSSGSAVYNKKGEIISIIVAANPGFENISILDIAKYVKEVLPNTTINVTPSNDPRSYRQCSDKILELGFVPKKNVKIAIEEIIKEFKNNKLNTSETCFSVKWLKKSLK